jgi:type 1 fimbriae regulatory protein FimB/type 1 fimbriae regulatory protein FimE
MLVKPHLAVVSPSGEKRSVSRGRRPNADLRKREQLTDTEVEKLIAAARTNRYGHRDATMILVTYRHGLRASEVCDLRWDDIDFRGSAIHVARKKNGVSTTQHLNGEELRALRRLQREQEPKSAYAFVTERGGPFDRTSFNFLVKRTGRRAGLPFQVHAHMLRHAAGYALANAGRDTRSIQAYLGHKDIRHTVRYTELSPTRFKNFFPD